MKTPMQKLYEKIPIDWDNPNESENAYYYLELEKNALRDAWNNFDGTDFEQYYISTYGKRTRQHQDDDSSAGS